MDHIFCTKMPIIIKKLVLLDGYSRTGKFFVGKLIAGLKRIEVFQSVNVMDQLSFIHRMGGIKEDAAICLIRSVLGEFAYNMVIGRYLNHRYDDASSIYNSCEFDEYLKRSLNRDRSALLSNYLKEGRSSLFLTHEALPNVQIFFKSYPDLKMINLIRHPVDVIHSWYLRGWGRRFGTDPVATTPVLNGPDGPVPWFAYGWKEEYYSISETDRVIKSIYTLTEKCKETYNSLFQVQKDQILFVRYENMVEKTDEVIQSIYSFLDTELSDYMDQIKVRERCPRTLPPGDREAKINAIKEMASIEYFNLMLKIVEEYENKENVYKVCN
jgi:hypothetical protein